MYSLQVFYVGDRVPRHIEHPSNAADLICRISRLLQEHTGCEKIVALNSDTRLFSVDCKGASLPG